MLQLRDERGYSRKGGGEQVSVQDLILNAKGLKDLSSLKSVGLHKLKGDRKSRWAMTVNARWRVCFTFKDGDAYDVEIVDYHKG